MTQTIGTDSNNDIYLGRDGNIAVLSGLPAMLSACETASKAQLGEMILQIGLGIPNFQAIWVGTPNYKLWESRLRNTLLGVLGVLEVKSIALGRKNVNTFTYTATIITQFGTAVING